MLSFVYRVEVWHAALLRLYNSFTPAWALAMVFAKWNTRAGLSCVSTEHWWLLANLFSLFFFLHKVAYFSLQMGGVRQFWGVVFFLLHTHHLWSLGISDKFPDCPKCRLINTQGDQDPSLGLSLFVWPCHHSHLKYWALMLWTLCVWRACTCPALLTRSKCTEMHASLDTCGSLVSVSCSGSPLRCVKLLLASCFLELPLS